MFADPQVLFRTVDDKKKFVLDFVAEDENNTWRQSTFQEQGVEAELYHVDTAEWLAAEFGNPKYAQGFTLRATVRMVNGQRAWSCPADSDVWNGHQADVDVIANGAVVAAIRLYSDKSLLSNKGTSVYPLKAILLNAPFAGSASRTCATSRSSQRSRGLMACQWNSSRQPSEPSTTGCCG